jgi:predicted nucleic acid-binding protein
VDYLATRYLGHSVARLFIRDVADGLIAVEQGELGDIVRAAELEARYASLNLGLVDGVVAAVAERTHAEAIVTLDLRDFGPLKLKGGPKLFPRDLPS